MLVSSRSVVARDCDLAGVDAAVLHARLRSSSKFNDRVEAITSRVPDRLYNRDDGRAVCDGMTVKPSAVLSCSRRYPLRGVVVILDTSDLGDLRSVALRSEHRLRGGHRVCVVEKRPRAEVPTAPMSLVSAAYSKYSIFGMLRRRHCAACVSVKLAI